MVEVVFSVSEKGAMRYGQHFGCSAGGATSVLILRSDGTQPSQEEYDAALANAKLRQEQEEKVGKPLGGSPDDVIGLSFALDIGDVSSPVTDASRRDLIAQMLDANPWDELRNLENSIRRFWDGCVADLEKLKTRAKIGEPIRIWYSDAPYSMCGFYETIDQLKDYECPISAVRLPDYSIPLEEQEAKPVTSWGEISPGAFAYYLPLESEISGAMRKAMITEWKKLKQENAPLRAVLNGKLHSIGMDFYDGCIRKEIPDGAFKVGQMIGLVLGRNQLGIGDWLIARRIEKMIESGELAVIRKDSAFYGTTIKKALYRNRIVRL